MLRRGSKTSYNPYATSRRVKKSDAKAKDQLDILPNKPNVWLKQVSVFLFYTRTHARTNRPTCSLLHIACSLRAWFNLIIYVQER